jgi:hypothetical protein
MNSREGKSMTYRNGGEGGILPLADYGREPSAAIVKTAFLKDLFD